MVEAEPVLAVRDGGRHVRVLAPIPGFVEERIGAETGAAAASRVMAQHGLGTTGADLPGNLRVLGEVPLGVEEQQPRLLRCVIRVHGNPCRQVQLQAMRPCQPPFGLAACEEMRVSAGQTSLLDGRGNVGVVLPVVAFVEMPSRAATLGGSGGEIVDKA